MKPALERHFNHITEEFVAPSRSGGVKYHITLTLDKPVTPLERIMFQVCLGSDPMRELLGYRRLMKDGDFQPTLFFEVPANE